MNHGRHMDGCIFCDREGILERIVHETDNFFVLLGLAIVTPGHAMIVTKNHYSCYGELPDELDEEFEDLKKRVGNKIEEEFARPFFVEYSPGWGQSVPHAHVHFIPSEGPGYSIESILEEMVIPGGIGYEEADMARLKEIYRNEGIYVSIEEKGKLYVCHVKDVPYDKEKPNPHIGYRQFFTQTVGLEGVSSWQKMTEEDKVRDEERRRITRERLKSI